MRRASERWAHPFVGSCEQCPHPPCEHPHPRHAIHVQQRVAGTCCWGFPAAWLPTSRTAPGRPAPGLLTAQRRGAGQGEWACSGRQAGALQRQRIAVSAASSSSRFWSRRAGDDAHSWSARRHAAATTAGRLGAHTCGGTGHEQRCREVGQRHAGGGIATAPGAACSMQHAACLNRIEHLLFHR